MGPIQTAIGQALGAVGGATLLGKKIYENEGGPRPGRRRPK